MTPQKPTPPPLPTKEQLPPELVALSRWVGWNFDWRGKYKRWAKQPCNPVTGVWPGWQKNTKSFDDAYKGAKQRRMDGIGFSPELQDKLVFVDFDDCLKDGLLDAAVGRQLRRLPGYVEITPSGEGLRVVVRGIIPRNVTKHPIPDSNAGSSVELYAGSAAHFVTITGVSFNGSCMTIPNAQAGIDELLEHIGFDAASPADSFEVEAEKTSGETTEAAAVRYFERTVRDAETLTEGRYSFLVRTCWWLGRILGSGPKDQRLTFENVEASITQAIKKTGWTELHHIGGQLRAGMKRPLVLRSKNEPEPLIVQDLVDFRTAEFPEREVLMKTESTPVFTKQSISQIFAWRGTGKSIFAFSITGAMATGGKFLNIQASRKIKVLYAEGEMPNKQIQERANLLIGATDPGFFRLITLDSQPNGIPALKTPEGRKLVEDAIADAEVLVIDSISSLSWLETNEEESWFDFLQWLIRLKSRGLCIIFLHHAGKGGLQRGHSKSEDALDVSIKLTADNSEERDYLKVRLEFDKFRGDRRGIRALSVNFKGGTWRWKVLETEKLNIVKEYLEENPKASSRTIAKARPELGSYVTVSKLMAKVVSIDQGREKPSK